MVGSECSDPRQVTDTDYIAYLDGQSGAAFIQHLPNCLFCQNEVAELQVTEQQLEQKLQLTKAANRPACPDTLVIGEYALGLGKALVRQQLEAHLGTCKYCTAEYREFTAWEALTLAEETKRTAVANSIQGQSSLKRLVAAILNTTPTTTPIVALRGELEQASPVTYRAEGLLVNVTVQRAGQNRRDFQVIGEIFAEDEAASIEFEVAETPGIEVRLVKDGTVLAKEQVDEGGNFFFATVASPEFDLELELPDRIIFIPGLQQNGS